MARDVGAWTRWVKHLPSTPSEHAAVLLAVAPTRLKERTLALQLPPTTLKDPVLKNEGKSEILDYFAFSVQPLGTACTLWEVLKIVILNAHMSKQIRVFCTLQGQLSKQENELWTLEVQYFALDEAWILKQLRNKLAHYNEAATRETKSVLYMDAGDIQDISE